MSKRTPTIKERVTRARRIRTKPKLNWTFVQKWVAFNALYGHGGAQNEEAQVMQCVRDHLPEKAAEQLLERCDQSIDYLLQIPPGDMRFVANAPEFRRRTSAHAKAIRDKSGAAATRAAHLAGILYQVRCNLLHGDKDPAVLRDRRLVTACAKVLDELVPALETAMQSGSA